MHNNAYRCNIVVICSIDNNVMSSLLQSMIIILSQGGRPQGYNKQYDLHLAFHQAQTGAGSKSFVLLYCAYCCSCDLRHHLPFSNVS